MNKLAQFINDFLLNKGVAMNHVILIKTVLLLLLVILINIVVYVVVKKVLLISFSKFSMNSKTIFDDLLVKNRVHTNIANIIPLLFTLEMTPTVFADYPYVENLVNKGLRVFGVVLILWIARSFLSTLKDYFKTLPRLKDKPIDSYIQVFMIFAWSVGIITVFAIITDISFLKFITTIGAGSAIIILIFRDTILGFVASIQVSINDMVRIGDWITFEKYGADGDVIEINLSTVKVQNFDKTITTIPTYALISDSFKNWRGMMNSDGRRIKRALIISLSSVKYLSKNEIDNLKNIKEIASYLTNRQDKIDSYNETHNIDKTLLLNGRNLTNLGVFRKYVETYLENHSAINKEMMIMCRQLAPTSQGIPLEIYAFSNDKRWKNYEYIMADIFDHLIAAIPYFDLEIFELPNTGNFKTQQNEDKPN